MAEKRQIEVYNSAFSLAMTEIDEVELEGIELPDPDDRHVVAGAIASGCNVIVTYNLKDFPESQLAARGVRAVRPDEFLMGVAEKAPDVVRDVVRGLVASKRRPPRTMEEELAGLRANLLCNFADFIESYEK